MATDEIPLRAAHAGTVSRQLAKAGHIRHDAGNEGFYVHASLTKTRTTVGYSVNVPRSPLGAQEREQQMNALRTTLETLGYTVEETRAKPGAPLHWLVLTTRPLGPSAAYDHARKALAHAYDTGGNVDAAQEAVNAAQKRYAASKRPKTRQPPAA